MLKFFDDWRAECKKYIENYEEFGGISKEIMLNLAATQFGYLS